MRGRNSRYSETAVDGGGRSSKRMHWRRRKRYNAHPGLRWLSTLLIVVGIALPAAGWASGHDPEGAQVIGHVQFEGKLLGDMVLTTGAGRRYLYVQHSDKEVSIVDVTDAPQPIVLKNTLWLEGAKVGDVTFFGDYAIGELQPTVCNRPVPEKGLAQNRSHSDNSLLLCSFNHVKQAILHEGLLYVLSDTGLWIVKPVSGNTGLLGKMIAA
jgi:hypothetical protein